MANVVPYSFAQELLKGTHNFVSNTINIALYEAGSGAPYAVGDTAYSSGTSNQVGTSGVDAIWNLLTRSTSAARAIKPRPQHVPAMGENKVLGKRLSNATSD